MTDKARELYGRWYQRLNKRQDIAALAVYRILFGTLMCVGTLRFMNSGWIERLYVQPSFHFKYWGFGWVQVPEQLGLYMLYSGIAISALLVALGAFYRLAIISFWCLFTYAELMDVSTYLNHYYFVSLLALILCFLSPHKAWSVDTWRKPAMASNSLPVWQTWWLWFQVGLLYFYAGWAKFEPDWLLHAQPLNIWLPPHSGMPLLGALLEQVWVHYAFSWFAFLFDVTIIGFMLIRRTRLLAFVVILVFHLFTHLFFNIGLFPLIMVLSVLVFFEPDWPRQWQCRWKQWRGQPAQVVSPVQQTHGTGWQPRSIVFAGLMLCFCALQFLMPLRQWLYPGTVLWHEQGMRFSWRVMLREKAGALSYRLRDQSGRTQIVTAHDYLTEQQYREMAGQPDLILQLAHHIRDDFNGRGVGPVRIYADSWVSLNGRPRVRLIRPDVDLALIQDGLGVASWIMPAPETQPVLQQPLRLSQSRADQ